VKFAGPRPAFGTAPRVTFGQCPAGDGLPAPHVDRAAARRTAQLAEARDALAVLPGPGETVDCLWTTRADLMLGLVAIIDHLGPVDGMRVATLAYSTRNLTEMLKLLDAGRVKGLTLLCSVFYARHYAEVFEQTVEEFRERGQRVAAARTHAKIVTFSFSSGRRLTLSGSANLRANGNVENLSITDGAGLHDFYARWIDDTVTRHEGEQGDNAGAG
jgi:hypothetical protein